MSAHNLFNQMSAHNVFNQSESKFKMYFANGACKEVGCLAEMEDGTLTFTGDTDASAKSLFENLIKINSKALKESEAARIKAQEELARRDDSAFNRKQLFSRMCASFGLEEDESSWFEIVDLIEKQNKAVRPIWNNCQHLLEQKHIGQTFREFQGDQTDGMALLVIKAVLLAVSK